jgi:hypothetical protein
MGLFKYRSRGSSVSMSGYGLDNRKIGVLLPSFVQTGSGAHPASCTVGTRGHFPRAKRGRGVTLTTHHHLVPRSRMSSSPLPSSATMACSGTTLLCYLNIFLCNSYKVKADPLHHSGAKGWRMYSSYSFLTSALDGANAQLHSPSAFYPRGKDPRYPLYWRLGGPQSRSGHREYRKYPLGVAGIMPGTSSL